MADAPPDDATMAIVDLIDGRSVREVAVSWPLHPELDSRRPPTALRRALVSRDGFRVLQLCYAATK